MSTEELLNSDANTEVSSEPQSEAGNEPAPEAQAAEPQQTQQPQEKEVPFHEHPRFRELVEQKNQFAERSRALEDQIRQLQQQFQQVQRPAAPKPEDKMIARLKSIDPEFGEYMEQLKSNLEKTQSELPEYRQWKEQVELTNIRNQALQTIGSLHEANKVPKDMQAFYQSQIEAVVSKDPNLTLNDLPAVYKQVHDSFSKLAETIRRQERESYVKTKSQDAKAPTVPLKGSPAPKAKEEQKFTGDPDDDRSAIVSSILSKMRAQKNA